MQSIFKNQNLLVIFKEISCKSWISVFVFFKKWEDLAQLSPASHVAEVAEARWSPHLSMGCTLRPPVYLHASLAGI